MFQNLFMRPGPYQWPPRFLFPVAPAARVPFLTMAFRFWVSNWCLTTFRGQVAAYVVYKTKFVTLFLEHNHSGQAGAKHKCEQKQNVCFTNNRNYSEVAESNIGN